MKKTNKQNTSQLNKRGFASRCASAIVCFALLLLGATAFAAPPANDNFANAQVVSGSTFNVSGTTVEATRESGEPTTVAYPGPGDPNRRSDAGDRSVWYSWTAPASGAFTLRTQTPTSGETDTQLGVYTGSLGNLTEVASSEDAFDGADNDNVLGLGQSQLSFNATSGTVYSIMVNGWNNMQIPFNLILTAGGSVTNPPPPPTGVSLTVTTVGSGTVTRNPSKTSYDTNEVVELTAVPSGTNTFVSWGGDAAAFGSTNPISITMDGNKTITATFTTGASGGGGGSNVLTVVINGNGTVSPNLNGRTLVPGRTYRLNARPGRDQLFSGWEGVSGDTGNPRLAFVMQEGGMVITANFAPNPFADPNNPVTGTYNGLLYDTNAITQGCSGNFSLRVQKTGKFTIRINKGGKTVSGSGQFDETGAATATVGRGANAMNLTLQLDMTGGTDTVTGTLVGPDCNATLEGDRAVFSAKNPTPLAGVYTLLLPRNTNNVNGNGFAVITVNKTGRVNIRGELADGTRINQGTTISKDGQVPVYIPLYRREGSLIGWLALTPTDASGLLSWIKPGANGFELDVETTGSPFDSKAAPLITLNNGTVELGGGGLAAPISESVTLDAKNKVVVAGDNANKIALRVNRNGMMQGNFVDPTTNRRTNLRGVVLQNANSANGYFRSADNTGYFDLSDPVLVPAPEEPPTETTE